MVSPAQLTMLEYLHERSGDSGLRIGLDPKYIRRGLRISPAQFAQASASLVDHGFVGVRSLRPDANDVPSATCSAIWVTGKGEDYLRRSHPGFRPAGVPVG